MKNRTNGLCVLLILSSSFVLACLAYVVLFRGIQDRIKDPHMPEFWQVRTMALQWRNPAREAREAFAAGEFAACQMPDDVTLTDLWIVDRASVPTPGSGVLASVGSEFILSTGTSSLNISVTRYRRAANSFAIEYNRELVRLMNEGRDVTSTSSADQKSVRLKSTQDERSLQHHASRKRPLRYVMLRQPLPSP